MDVPTLDIDCLKLGVANYNHLWKQDISILNPKTKSPIRGFPPCKDDAFSRHGHTDVDSSTHLMNTNTSVIFDGQKSMVQLETYNKINKS